MLRTLVVALAALVCVCAAQADAPLSVPYTQLDPLGRCEPFPDTAPNCQGIIPAGSLVYYNSTETFEGQQAASSAESGTSVIPTLG